jgi:hypothetical protein
MNFDGRKYKKNCLVCQENIDPKKEDNHREKTTGL